MKNKRSHYFHILFCQGGSFYGNYTTRPEHRLTEHSSGTGARYTRLAKRRPVIMIHTGKFKTHSETTRVEAAFKKLTHEQKEQYLKTSH